MAERKTISKQKLHIVKHDVDVPYAQGTKALDRLQAENLSLPEGDPLFGKPLRMTIFKKELKEYIRGKETVVADIEETPRPETEYGPDRTIVQVYDDDGNPVSRKSSGPGGGNYRRPLAEDLALVSVQEVGLLIRSSEGRSLVADDKKFNDLVKRYLGIVGKGLTLAANPPQAFAGNAPDTRQDAKSAGDQGGKVQSDAKTENGRIKNVGDLLTRSSKLDPPVSRDEILKSFDVTDPTEIGDLDGAWSEIQRISADKKARSRA